MTTATHEVLKYAVKLELPQARRSLQTIVNHLLDENDPMGHWTFTPRDAQDLQVLLDRLDQTDGEILWNHD